MMGSGCCLWSFFAKDMEEWRSIQKKPKWSNWQASFVPREDT
jgi:hypothetical protein